MKGSRNDDKNTFPDALYYIPLHNILEIHHDTYYIFCSRLSCLQMVYKSSPLWCAVWCGRGGGLPRGEPRTGFVVLQLPFGNEGTRNPHKIFLGRQLHLWKTAPASDHAPAEAMTFPNYMFQ